LASIDFHFIVCVCVPQKKASHKGLKQHEGYGNFHFFFLSFVL